ncbi:MAG: hypothetical protein QNL03_02750 [Gammaproteobacteria bacterium]|nr:hypothetical protein [Gammaproteobacteria bacterium]
MTALSDFAYAQVRLQSRYGQRADEHVWLRLHNILDLASYLQVTQQTALRPWVLGIGSSHSSHEIELALRQKYRHHVDEVAGWMPADWRVPLQWIKRLADLPALQYLLADGTALDWMKSDPDISKFTIDDSALRLQAMRVAGCASLVDAWQQGDTMFAGWLSHWKKVQPRTPAFNKGLQNMEDILHQQLQLQARQQHTGKEGPPFPADYDLITDKLRVIFRRYAFQPAAVCAYLAIIAMDIHHVRSSLIQRLLFLDSENFAQGLPL